MSNDELVEQVVKWILTAEKSGLPYQFHAKAIISLIQSPAMSELDDFERRCHLCTKPIENGQSRTGLNWIDSDKEFQVRTVHRKCKENLLNTRQSPTREVLERVRDGVVSLYEYPAIGRTSRAIAIIDKEISKL